MKLIIEEAPVIEYLVESKGEKKQHYIEGIFLQSEITNRNGRRYPLNVMEQAVNDYVENHIKVGNAYGECDHPRDRVNVELKNACILIEKLDFDKNDVLGKAIIANNNQGDTIRGLLEIGGKIGVSSRGLGTLKPKDGIVEVQNDFRLITAADCVATPSAPGAFVNGILEGVEWFFDEKHGDWRKQEIFVEARDKLKTMNKRELEESTVRVFNSIMRKIQEI